MKKQLIFLLIPVVLIAFGSNAQDAGKPTEDKMTSPEKPYSPYAGNALQTNLYWGETHLHTGYSMDAGAFGCRLGPEDAYKFASGHEVTSSAAGAVKLARPLDFLVVADHSDNMGFFPDLFSGKPELLADPTGKKWYGMVQEGGDNAAKAAFQIIDQFSKGTFPDDLMYYPDSKPYKDAWARTVAAAEKYNNPGIFTAFIGYEWTSQLPPGDNLHRCVILRDNSDRALQVVPFTTYPPAGSTNPEDLWTWMEMYESKTGGDVLAIPHNGNLSNGLMFPVINPVSGEAITEEYAVRRAMWEPLVEVTQTKGDGEAHPMLSPTDEFADFATWDKGNLNLSEGKDPDMLQYEYVRSALKIGLELEEELGTNPYKFGLVGATDSHTGLSTSDDDNFYGKVTSMEPNPERTSRPFVSVGDRTIMEWEVMASGYQGVWATDNTREAIFDAMERKETYATTGPRIMVRFFGGWDFIAQDAKTRQPAVVGYEKGVPMGGDLTKAPAGKSPTFLIAALKDPIGANLDRVQVIKGWLDKDGELHERVYDVAVSDGRTIDKSGRCKTPVGNTVDLENATWYNTIGNTEMISVWKDPDFDPAERAFYYVRVIQIPTPRWTVYDAKFYGLELGDDVRKIDQERAYTSPIWYTP